MVRVCNTLLILFQMQLPSNMAPFKRGFVAIDSYFFSKCDSLQMQLCCYKLSFFLQMQPLSPCESRWFDSCRVQVFFSKNICFLSKCETTNAFAAPLHALLR